MKIYSFLPLIIYATTIVNFPTRFMFSFSFSIEMLKEPSGLDLPSIIPSKESGVLTFISTVDAITDSRG